MGNPEDRFSHVEVQMAWPWYMNINENVQPPVDCEMVTKYCAILFINLGEFRFNLCNDKDQTFFFRCININEP